MFKIVKRFVNKERPKCHIHIYTHTLAGFDNQYLTRQGQKVSKIVIHLADSQHLTLQDKRLMIQSAEFLFVFD